MDGRLIFTKVNGHAGGFLISENRLVSASFLGNENRITGGIYIARVKDALKNLNAFFVEISGNKSCFLPGTECQTPFFLNPNPGKGNTPRQIREGDLILVQGFREAQKTKQPAVTTKISISNPYFVISFGNTQTGYSSKLSVKRKKEIKELLVSAGYTDKQGNYVFQKDSETDLNSKEDSKESGQNQKLPIPEVGLIVRTECGNAKDDELLEALDSLSKEFSEYIRIAAYRTYGTCLRKAPSPWEEVLKKAGRSEEYQEIVTDDPELFSVLKKQRELFPGKDLRWYEDDAYPLEKLYSLSTKLQEALKTRIWLKSGAYLIIEPTEALTVIDVNSGKFEAHRQDLSYIRKINLEAAAEIAKQIRLRNLSGMILVDFINPDRQEDQEELIQKMTEWVKEDRIRTNIIDFTKLGLMEITRQKMDAPLLEQAKAVGFPLPKRQEKE